jgi:hypothetical protein
MPKVAKALTALEAKRLTDPGMHAVGTVPGLYLRIQNPPSTAKTWILRFQVDGRRRDIELAATRPCHSRRCTRSHAASVTWLAMAPIRCSKGVTTPMRSARPNSSG